MLGFSIVVRNETSPARGFLVKDLCTLNSGFISSFNNKSCGYLQEVSRLLSSGYHCQHAFWRRIWGFHVSQQQVVSRKSA